MSMADESGFLTSRIRTLQIIVAALVMGVLTALITFCSLRALGNVPPAPPTPMVSYVAVAFAVMIVMPFAIVPALLVTTARKRLAHQYGEGNDTLVSSLFMTYQTKTIIGCALLEGVAFFQVIAYFLEGQQISLILAVAFMAGIALHFPTRTRVERWIERQTELIEQEKAVG
jgi:hypothetical protein